MPTTDRRVVLRRFRITGGASPAAPSPMIHGEVNAKLPRGTFTLADLVRWLVLLRPVTPISWRSASLPAVPYRQMTTPPIRILALSPAPVFRDACYAHQRLRVLPTGRVSGLPGRPILSRIRLSEQLPKSPRTLARSTTRDIPNSLPRPVPNTVIFRVEPGRRMALSQANRLCYCRHRRMANLPVRSPTNGLSRRFIALSTRLFFALHRCAPSTCQNDKWPPEGRI